jgi:hypothetical protein
MDGTDQYRGRKTYRFDDKVEHPVHSIGEININVTGWTVHYLGSGCAPGAAVTAQVLLTTIGFGFDDYSGDACLVFPGLRATLGEQRMDEIGGRLAACG